MPYDQIRIQTFLAEKIVNLQDFCFFLENRLNNPQFAFRNLPCEIPSDKSREIVLRAEINEELGELVFQLTDYWLHRNSGNPRVLVQRGFQEELYVFHQELMKQGKREKAEKVLNLLKEFLPKNLLKKCEQSFYTFDYISSPDKPIYFKHGYAALIGVGEQLDQKIQPLPVTVKDVYGIRDLLKDSTRCCYPEDHIHLVIGPGATRQAILGSLDWLAEKAKQDPEATIIFYFSGHGWKKENGSTARYYLIPYDCKWERVTSTSVCEDVFTEKLRTILAKRLLVILDACHAGGVTKESVPLPKGFHKRAPSTSQLVRGLGSGSGKVIISSSREYELSYVRSDHSQSIFTSCLIKALSGEAYSSHQGKIGIIDVFNYLDRHVQAAIEFEGYYDPQTGKPAQQHPVLDSTKTDNFPIALFYK